MTIRLHTTRGITFMLDTNDWVNKSDADIAETELVKGLDNLTIDQLKVYVDFATCLETECDLRNGNHFSIQPIEKIECDAYSIATQDYISHPEIGHNCDIILAELIT